MDFLIPAVESAFSMITIAVEELGNPAQMDSSVSRFAGYIFGYDVDWPYVLGDYFQLFKTRRYGLTNEYQARFAKLNEARVDDRPILIYCDQKRLQKHPQGMWVDTIYKEDIIIGRLDCICL
jgi:hypothetical protein